MYNQLSGWPLAQSSWDIKLTIIVSQGLDQDFVKSNGLVWVPVPLLLKMALTQFLLILGNRAFSSDFHLSLHIRNHCLNKYLLSTSSPYIYSLSLFSHLDYMSMEENTFIPIDVWWPCKRYTWAMKKIIGRFIWCCSKGIGKASENDCTS